ncbi:unnamed protein product, partial [Mesorhabditis spiculigera]
MLAPIITKDMDLFPKRNLNGIKNVRSRAQSLTQVSQSRTQSLRVRVAPARPRTSQSVGNLPTAGRSPPKLTASRKTTLNPIEEGVEWRSDDKPATASAGCLPDEAQLRIQQLRGLQGSPDGNLHEGKENNEEPKGKNEKYFQDGKKNRVMRWITNAFRSRSRSDSGDEAMSTNSS